MKGPLLGGEPSVPFANVKSRSRLSKSTPPFNRTSKIQKCKLNKGNIDSLSNSGQTIMDVL